MVQYLITIITIIVISFFQIRKYRDTKRKITDYRNIFPKSSNNYFLINNIQEKEILSADNAHLRELLIKAGLKEEDYSHEVYKIDPKTGDGRETTELDTEKAQQKLLNESKKENGIATDAHSDTLDTIIKSINDYLQSNKTVSDFHLMKDIVDRNCDIKDEEISAQIPIPQYLGLIGTMIGITIGVFCLLSSGGISALLSANGLSNADGIEGLLGGVALAMITSIVGLF
jgi:hypothetical protein